MAREKEGYRLNIELLNARFPEKDMLTVAEAAAFMGVSESTVRRRIRFPGNLKRITKADLARQVSA